MYQASFFWKNDQPGGFGFTLGAPNFSEAELKLIFEGEVAKKYMRDSDEALGTGIVYIMMAQLEAIGKARALGDVILQKQVILAALNIMWLSSRGFIPNDEFNGPQFVNLVPAPKRATP